MKVELTIKNDTAILNILKENAIAFIATAKGVKFYFASMKDAKEELQKLSKKLGNSEKEWFCIPQIGGIDAYTWRKIKKSEIEKSDFLQRIFQ